jgi:hypothetical protein
MWYQNKRGENGSNPGPWLVARESLPQDVEEEEENLRTVQGP